MLFPKLYSGDRTVRRVIPFVNTQDFLKRVRKAFNVEGHVNLVTDKEGALFDHMEFLEEFLKTGETLLVLKPGEQWTAAGFVPSCVKYPIPITERRTASSDSHKKVLSDDHLKRLCDGHENVSSDEYQQASLDDYRESLDSCASSVVEGKPMPADTMLLLNDLDNSIDGSDYGSFTLQAEAVPESDEDRKPVLTNPLKQSLESALDDKATIEFAEEPIMQTINISEMTENSLRSGPYFSETPNWPTVPVWPHYEMFRTETSVRNYISLHPKTRMIDFSKKLTIADRKMIVRTIVQKLITIDPYPPKTVKLTLAGYLSNICSLPTTCFFNKKNKGYMAHALDHVRRSLMPYEKKYRRLGKTRKSTVEQPPGVQKPYSCKADCPFSEGTSEEEAIANLDLMKDLSIESEELLLHAFKKSYCYRQSLTTLKFSEQVTRVPMYASNPELVLHDFRLVHGEDAAKGLLTKFEDIVRVLSVYCTDQSWSSVKELAWEMDHASGDTRLFKACQILMHFLPRATNFKKSKRINILMVIVPDGYEYQEVATEAAKYPKIFALETPEKNKFMYKILFDGVQCEAGADFISSLDILFKMFWVFNISYPGEISNFMQFLQNFYYKINFNEPSISPRAIELTNHLISL